MLKNQFLIVDLNESKTKKIAETITSDTSRCILNYLAEKEKTETDLAKELSLPLSTVHYHLQKLQAAGLVIVEEFHYSMKGKEVNHYKLANKYILILPKADESIQEKLKTMLFVFGILGIVGFLVMFTSSFFGRAQSFAASEKMTVASAQMSAQTSREVIFSDASFVLWFFLGTFVMAILYLIMSFLRKK